MATLSKEQKKRDKKFWKEQIWNEYKIGKYVKETTWIEKQEIKATWKEYILIQSAYIEYVMEENAAEFWDNKDPLVTIEGYYNFLGDWIKNQKDNREELDKENEEETQEYLNAKNTLIKRYEDKNAKEKNNPIGFRLPN
jgi:hypothetical protein